MRRNLRARSDHHWVGYPTTRGGQAGDEGIVSLLHRARRARYRDGGGSAKIGAYQLNEGPTTSDSNGRGHRHQCWCGIAERGRLALQRVDIDDDILVSTTSRWERAVHLGVHAAKNDTVGRSDAHVGNGGINVSKATSLQLVSE